MSSQATGSHLVAVGVASFLQGKPAVLLTNAHYVVSLPVSTV